MRPWLEHVRYPDLDIADCIDEMTWVVASLDSLDTHRLQEIQMAVFRARRHHLQAAGLVPTGIVTPHPTTPLERPPFPGAQAVSIAQSHNAQFNQDLNEIIQDIEDLRGSPGDQQEPQSDPNPPRRSGWSPKPESSSTPPAWPTSTVERRAGP